MLFFAHWKRLSVIVGLSVLLAVMFIATGDHSTALAAGLCKANPSFANCDNQDPVVEGCNLDDVLLVSQNIYSGPTLVGQVLIRYSNACQSAWGRVVSYIGSANLYVQFTRNGTNPFFTNSGGYDTSIRTLMGYALFQPVRACGSINGASACTP